MIERIKEAIRSEKLDGWLFSNFRHRDPIADSLLGIPSGATNTRRWFYLLSAEGRELKVVHAIEPSILAGLPGEEIRYSSMAELMEILRGRCRGTWACDYSENLPVVSFMDAGTLLLLESCGIACQGADSLIQRVNGLLDARGIASHRKAADALGGVVRSAWALVSSAYGQKREIREGEIRDAIQEAFAAQGLVSDHPPIVAAGPATADPHYDFSGSGRAIREGDVIQVDIWAKGKGRDDIYADISWIGVYAPEPSPRQVAMAADLFSARDHALALVRQGLASGVSPRGSDIDADTRSFLIGLGHGAALRHRTGHGIDRECHGSGVNLDAVEFPDRRRILEGSCFSIEPGIYEAEFGMRTEIDVYIEGGAAKVSGPEPQTRLLVCGA